MAVNQYTIQSEAFTSVSRAIHKFLGVFNEVVQDEAYLNAMSDEHNGYKLQRETILEPLITLLSEVVEALECSQASTQEKSLLGFGFHILLDTSVFYDRSIREYLINAKDHKMVKYVQRIEPLLQYEIDN